MTGKIYCFVDETGQHTEGKSFIVGMVLCDADVDDGRKLLEGIEKATGKGVRKWTRSNDAIRRAYIVEVFKLDYFAGRLYFQVTHDSRAFFELTAHAVIAAVRQRGLPQKVTIIVDGLEGRERDEFRRMIRKERIPVDKVRGARDESEPMIRLADALCGFLADAYGGREEFAVLRDKLIDRRMLIQLK